MKKIVKILLIVFVLLAGILISLPFIFKDKILGLVKTEINNNVQAKVDFKDYDVSIFTNFPDISFSLGNLSVVGVDNFDGDTLTSIGSFVVSLDIMSVISGDEMNINTISIKDANINLIILKDGTANWDIAKPDSSVDDGTASESKFNVSLKKYELVNCNLSYDDASMDFSVKANGLFHEGKGDFTQDLFNLVTNTSIDALTMIYEGIPYLNSVKTGLAAELEMDLTNSKYTFRENELTLNSLALQFDGFLAMPADDIDMDLKFNVLKNDFASFISMVPGIYTEGFENVKSSGDLAFNGYVKGKYNEISMPGFGVVLNIDNGMLQYPDLPTALNNVKVDLKIDNPDGVPDHTIIDLRQLHFELGNEPFDAKMVVKTPVSDADINAVIKGKINLANIKTFVPLEDGTEMSGQLNADVTAIGRMSAIDNKRYEDFNANGSISLEAFNYKSNDIKDGLLINECELIFNPKNITLNKFHMVSGSTDIRASGWLDNLLAYTFKENELLKGTLSLKSKEINLNDFMSESENTASADTVPMSVIEIPENIDFLITAEIDKVIYDDLELTNMKSNIAMRDQTLGLNGFSCNTLDGILQMDGLYDSKNIKSPFFYFDVKAISMDIKKTYDKFVAVRKLAPIAEKCQGLYSSSMNVKGNLDSNMEPIYTSLTGGGKLSTKQVTVDNFKPLVKVADALKMDQFKQLKVSDVNLSFKFENGRVNVEPFDVNIDGMNATVQGSNGFDQTIDYNIAMKIPVSKMGSSATNVVSGLISQANQAAGTNLSMGNEVKVNVKITGTVNDPKIETGLKEAAGNAVKDVKEQVKEQFNEAKKELEDKAKAEAEKLKQEAETKAKEEIDKMKKEAEEKAKAEAEKQKQELDKKLKKEAEDQLKNLFGKPKK